MQSLLVALFLHHVTLPKSTVLNNHQNVKVEERISLLSVKQTSSGIQSFPAGSLKVPFLHLSLSSSCSGSTEIDGIEFKHKGLGDVKDISSVYLLNGNRRLLRGRQIQKDGTVNLNFRPLIIPACKTINITLAADFSEKASVVGQHYFILESASHISTNAKVNLQKISSSKIRKPSVIGGATLGTISVEYPKILRRIRYGKNQIVSRIMLKADNKSNHNISAITLTNNGSANNEDLKNLFFEYGANKVATSVASSLDGDIVRLEFNPPIILKKNQSKQLRLRADVLVGRSKTINLVVEEKSDIEAQAVRGR